MIIRFWRLSLRRAGFFFVLKLKVNTDLEQVLTCSYSKVWLLKIILCCCNFLSYLSSLRAPYNHIMFRSPLEIVAFTSGYKKQHGKFILVLEKMNIYPVVQPKMHE